MKDFKKIHDFANKWLNEFNNLDNFNIDVDKFLSECEELGFVLNYSKPFIEKYSVLGFEIKTFEGIIDKLSVDMLTNTIYSNMYFFKTNNLSDLKKENNISWFILALSRLSYLTLFKENYKVKAIGINSSISKTKNGNNKCQLFMVNDKYECLKSNYVYNPDSKLLNNQNIVIEADKENAKVVFDILTDFFFNCYENPKTNAYPDFDVDIETEEGRYKFYGFYYQCFLYEGQDLSTLIRETLKYNDICLFDCFNSKRYLNYFEIKYYAPIKFNPYNTKDDNNYVWVNSRETISFNRETEISTFSRWFDSCCMINNTYKSPGIMTYLFEIIEKYDFSSRVNENYKDINTKRTYSIILRDNKGEKKEFKGYFTKSDLPKRYNELAETINEFFNAHLTSDILDSKIYGIDEVSNGNLLVYVKFNNSSKEYCYLTKDSSIKIDDYVVVPVGYSNSEMYAKVSRIEILKSEEETPIPFKRIKWVIRKCELEETEGIEF